MSTDAPGRRIQSTRPLPWRYSVEGFYCRALLMRITAVVSAVIAADLILTGRTTTGLALLAIALVATLALQPKRARVPSLNNATKCAAGPTL